MHKRLTPILAAPLLLALAGCASLQQGFGTAVYMDYDQTDNFRTYGFEQPHHFPGEGGDEVKGISGWENLTNTKGFWATFVICNLRNEGSQAQTFDYDASKFYVVYDGQEHHYRPMSNYTYSTWPGGLAGTQLITDSVKVYFPEETQLGLNTDSFQEGYYPSVNHRIAIYITRTSPGPPDLDERLNLRYSGSSNVMNPRNQPPVVHDPAYGANLATTCRPPAQS
ncbi:MAG TPA: hypothetical protein VFR37_16850 [Longimicrobium sp.]|nr:hypothetical protein [Longimicrobium sp.]